MSLSVHEYIYWYMLTDMKKLLVTLDDETANLLAHDKNKSATVREAIRYIKLDITPDTIEGLRKSYSQVARILKEMDSKLDYLAQKEESRKPHSTPGPIQQPPYTITSTSNWEEPLQTSSSHTGELSCCGLPKPCKHWQWDGAAQVHTNTLSGITQTVNPF